MNPRLFTEDRITLHEAAQEVDTHPATVDRWRRSGKKSNGGRMVKLECYRLNRSWVTTRQALRRFLLAINDSTPGAETLHSPTAASAILDAIGIYPQ